MQRALNAPLSILSARSLAVLRLAGLFAATLFAVASLLSPNPTHADAQPGSAQSPTANPPTTNAARQATNVAIIPIRGEIDAEGVMATSVERRIGTAVRAGADAIVFEIDTPGGEIRSALRICNAIKKSPITNTVAWVNTDAYSAGALIAMACREIVVNDPASFGDAMPIAIGRRGASAMKGEILKKMLPPVVAEVLDSARRHNKAVGHYEWDEHLTKAIVANDVELWWVRNPTTGVEMAIDREEFEMLFPGESTEGAPRLANAPGTGRSSDEFPPIPGAPATPTAENPIPAPPPTSEKPAETTSDGRPIPAPPSGSEKLRDAAVAVEERQSLPSTRPVLTAKDKGEWELVEKVLDGSAPAMLRAEDALRYNFAANDTKLVNGEETLIPIKNDADIQSFFGATNIRRLERSWSEGLVFYATAPWLRGVLIVALLIGLFVEMSHPGTIIGGAIALIALLALVGPPLIIGMANWWEVAAIFLGLLLLAAEVFVLPGFGVAGLAGIALLLLGLIGTFLPQGTGLFPNSPRGQSDLLWGAVTILLAIATAGIGIFFLAKYLDMMPGLNRLVLKDPTTDPDADDVAVAKLLGPDLGAPARVGDIGTALTPLRPSGRVQIGEDVIDASAEVGFIDAGTKVKVVSVTGFKIGVEKASA